MSFSELCVVLIVAIIIMKPEDIPVIVNKFKQIKVYFNNLKSDVITYFNKELQIEGRELSKDIDEINFYLQKIASLNGEYEGDYSLKDIKNKYHQLVQRKLEK